MNPTYRRILKDVANGKVSIEEAEKLIDQTLLAEVNELAKLDVGREARKGIPEVVYGEDKSVGEIHRIISKSLEACDKVIVSRLTKDKIKKLKQLLNDKPLRLSEKAGVLVVKSSEGKVVKTGGRVGILTAGTSDLKVAEEAKVMAEEMGCEVYLEADVGVAGVHRLIPALKHMLDRQVDVIVVVAGREGALPSVVAGLVSIPVIGVPTSSSYGFGEKGLAALMAMLQSCSLGIGVVNIDNGIGGGALAALIANNVAAARSSK
ncbi:MAG: nickel pincer cofactor biosynthesis protein LarB [Nitrososphaerales archaeon]